MSFFKSYDWLHKYFEANQFQSPLESFPKDAVFDIDSFAFKNTLRWSVKSK